MKRRIWIIPLLAMIVSVFILFRPIGLIAFNKTVSENRILIQYEIFGCGSLVVRVLDGGEELTEDFREEYPNIGNNEIVFSSDSVQPKAVVNTADFYTAHIAEKYTYIIEGEAVGVTKGAPDCCEPGKAAYNETVVEFRADKWYLTEYVPYAEAGSNVALMLTAMLLMAISVVWIIVLAVREIILKNRM